MKHSILFWLGSVANIMPFFGFELKFHPKETAFPIDVDTHTKTLHPCYCFQGSTSYLGKSYIYRSFRWYYTQNPAIGCCYVSPSTKWLGSHQHDVEGITILFDDSDIPCHVYFHAHGIGQGNWRTWDACAKTSQGLLIVYVARGSHASYPMEGVYLRAFGFANDCTSRHGICKIYQDFLKFNASESVVIEGKRFSTPIRKALPPTSFSLWKRLFLPCCLPKI